MFQSLEPRPPDPILGLSAAFKADSNPNKIDLGVGVYKDETGNTPVIAAIKKAERKLWEAEDSKSYIAQAGPDHYNRHVLELLFGGGHPALADKRAASILAPGGSGALRLGAEFVNKNHPGTRTWVSTPTWANHIPLLSSAGLNLVEYPYYDYERHTIRFDRMMEALREARKGDLVLLHGCCHNPCGADLSPQQWRDFLELARKNGFTPFIDMAYQGLGDGIDEDAYGLRLLAENLPELLVASSYSKNFGLYRERTGALTVVTRVAGQLQAATSQILATAREIYSMPPSHGAVLVGMVLDDVALKAQWLGELTEMRTRINGLRGLLVEKLGAEGVDRDFGFIEREKGLFSFLGLTVDQIQYLVKEYSIYLVSSSRINVAGINTANIDYLAKSIATVLKQ